MIGRCCVSCTIAHLTNGSAERHRKTFDIDGSGHAWIPLRRAFGSVAEAVDVCSCGSVRKIVGVYARREGGGRRAVWQRTTYYRIGKAGPLKRKPRHT